MLQFLVLGDTHWDGMPSRLPDSVRQAALPMVIEQVTHYAKIHGVSTIVQVGDLLDSPFPSTNAYMQILDMLLTHRLRWRIIRGNHEVDEEARHSFQVLQLLANRNALGDVRFFTQPEWELLDKIGMIYLPWPHTTHSRLNKPSFVFAHVSRKGSLADNGYALKEGSEFDLGQSFWYIGDLHRPQRGPQYEYVGAPLQLKFDDVPKRHFIHVKATIKNGKLKQVRQRIPIIPPYTLHQITAYTADDLRQLESFGSTDYIQIKASSELLAATSEITRKYPNTHLVALPGNKLKTPTAKVEVGMVNVAGQAFTDRKPFIKRHLKQQGFTKQQVLRGLEIARKTERQARS